MARASREEPSKRRVSWSRGPYRGAARHPDTVRESLEARGKMLRIMPTVAGDINAIQFHNNGDMAAALDGDLLRAGVKFELPR
jgi:gamma-glutamyltranspeptidase/glutathione hydrolase